MTTTSEPSVITEEHVSTASRPSALRITDLRVANLHGVPFRSSIIRIDTNQGLVGYGEVRDQASATFALCSRAGSSARTPATSTRSSARSSSSGTTAGRAAASPASRWR